MMVGVRVEGYTWWGVFRPGYVRLRPPLLAARTTATQRPWGPTTSTLARERERTSRRGEERARGQESERASERVNRVDQTHAARKKEAREVRVGERRPTSRARVTERKKKEKQTENPHPGGRLVRDFFVLSVRTKHPWKQAVRF